MRGFKWDRNGNAPKPFFLQHPRRRRQAGRPTEFIPETPKPIIPGANVTDPIGPDFKAELQRGYAEWMSKCEKDGFDIFSINFMFDGNRESDPTPSQMANCIQKYYSALTTQLYRRPRSKDRRELPILLAHAEGPSLLQQSIKGSGKIGPGEFGIHYHGFLAAPPEAKTWHSFLEAHKFAEKKAKSRGSLLVRIHIEPTWSLEAWSLYITKQRTRRGEHFMDQFDILFPLGLDHLPDVATDLRRPRPKRKARKKSPRTASRMPRASRR